MGTPHSVLFTSFPDISNLQKRTNTLKREREWCMEYPQERFKRNESSNLTKGSGGISEIFFKSSFTLDKASSFSFLFQFISR